MRNIFIIHWNEKELKGMMAPLKNAGYKVAGHWSTETTASLKEPLPDVLIISLERLPSHGKAYAEWLWEAKKRQHIPIVFAGGKPEKVEPFKSRFPKAIFCEAGDLVKVITNMVKP